MSQKPTLRDVARAANAGVSTVSLALRDDPRIRPDTRRHIQETAHRLGYQTNALVANLMAQLRASRSEGARPSLALVNVSPSGRDLEDLPTFRAWQQAVRDRAHALGYDLAVYRLQEAGQSPAELQESLQADGVRGVILAGLSTGASLPHTYSLLWENYANVVLGLRPITPPLHFSCNDQYATAQECVYRLSERGYQRPGLVINPATDTVLEERFTSGFRAAQGRLMMGSSVPIHPFQPDREEDFRRWMDREQPDVLVTLHEEVRDWADHLGLRVPQDIGLAHLDCTQGGSGNWSGMDQNSHTVGVSAVDTVIGQIHRHETGVPTWAKCVLNASSWVEGETTRPLPARAYPLPGSLRHQGGAPMRVPVDEHVPMQAGRAPV
jgi:LacI family transcriptional regulator